MNYITGSERGEVLLLPDALEDYIAPENPVRFIDAFVGQLDLGKKEFLCRGKRQVSTEVNLTVLAYNLKRVCNLVGVQNLIAAVS